MRESHTVASLWVVVATSGCVDMNEVNCVTSSSSMKSLNFYFSMQLLNFHTFPFTSYLAEIMFATHSDMRPHLKHCNAKLLIY